MRIDLSEKGYPGLEINERKIIGHYEGILEDENNEKDLENKEVKEIIYNIEETNIENNINED